MRSSTAPSGTASFQAMGRTWRGNRSRAKSRSCSAKRAERVFGITRYDGPALNGLGLKRTWPLDRFGRGMDGGAYALISAAPADIGDRRGDIGVRRLGFFSKQRHGRHHHSALAIAALRHIEVEPGLLDRMELAVLRQRFDRGDGLRA